ncbi:MAG: DNA-binding response regulator, partial [Pseudomonadota bacterium]
MTMHDKIDQNIALVVDDDPASLTMVSTALEESGMTVIVARDGRTAIDLANRVRPDVILLDALMPNMDGFETCRRLKAPPFSIPTPVVFMTGLSDANDVVRGLNAGGVDYITKPIVIDEMIARIGVHIVNSNLIQSARNALDQSGRSLLAFDRDGNLRWGSDKALEEIQNDNDTLSGIKGWVIANWSKPISQIDPFETEQLQFQMLGRSTSDEVLVKYKTNRTESNQDLLARELSLTAREAEVLYWLTMGKTNRDISVILSLSPRTVNKHLEQIFQKMGVGQGVGRNSKRQRHIVGHQRLGYRQL